MTVTKEHWKSNHPNYRAVHAWLSRYHGKASKCEMPNCKNNSTTFHWSLKDGKDYEKNIENFWQLCASCHQKYDQTEDTRNRLRESGKVNSWFVKDNPMNYEAFRKKVSESKMGIKMSSDARQKISNGLKGRIIPDDIKLKISLSLSGANSPSARKVICTESGKTFDTIKEAAAFVGLKYTTLVMMLRGVNRNKTTLKYAE